MCVSVSISHMFASFHYLVFVLWIIGDDYDGVGSGGNGVSYFISLFLPLTSFRIQQKPFQPKIRSIYEISSNTAVVNVDSKRKRCRQCTGSNEHVYAKAIPSLYYKHCKLWDVISSSITSKTLSIRLGSIFTREIHPAVGFIALIACWRRNVVHLSDLSYSNICTFVFNWFHFFLFSFSAEDSDAESYKVVISKMNEKKRKRRR